MRTYKVKDSKTQEDARELIKKNAFLDRLYEIELCDVDLDRPGNIRVSSAFGDIKNDLNQGNYLILEKKLAYFSLQEMDKGDNLRSLVNYDNNLRKNELVDSTRFNLDKNFLTYSMQTNKISEERDVDRLMNFIHICQMKLSGKSDFNFQDLGFDYLSGDSKREIRRILGSMDSRKYKRIIL